MPLIIGGLLVTGYLGQRFLSHRSNVHDDKVDFQSDALDEMRYRNEQHSYIAETNMESNHEVFKIFLGVVAAVLGLDVIR